MKTAGDIRAYDHLETDGALPHAAWDRGSVRIAAWVLGLSALACSGEPASDAQQPASVAQTVTAPGVVGEYFDRENLTEHKFTRTDAAINFNWSNGSPDPSIHADSFSIRWTGKITPNFTEAYTLSTHVYDGVRLWLGNQLVIDDWSSDETQDSVTLQLVAGQSYDFRMEYVENGGAAVARLEWSSARETGGLKKPIPPAAFSQPGSVPTQCDGSAVPESLPAPVNGPEIIHRNTFEAEDPNCWATRPTAGCGPYKGIKGPVVIAQDEKRRSGRKSMKLTFSSNEQEGGGYLNPNATHLFSRQYDFYERDFDFARGMKIGRFSGFNTSTQRNDYDIILVSAATLVNSDVCGKNEMGQLFLQRNDCCGTWQFLPYSFPREQWIAIETEIKLNTPGQANGEVRVFVDGVKQIEKVGLADVRSSSTLPLTSTFIGGWYSNRSTTCSAPNPVSVRYIDDLILSSRYIGPEPTLAPGPDCTGIEVRFRTPVAGTTQVEYGTTASYGSTTPLDSTQTTDHRQVLTGLTPGRAYHYRVRSTWSNGYQYVSPDYTFVAATR